MLDPNLVSLVYDTKHMDALSAFLQIRINNLKEALVMAEPNEVPRLQSAIIELKKLQKLKETVLNSKRD